MKKKEDVSTWSKNFAIIEMRRMPAVNIFHAGDGIGLSVLRDVGCGVKSGCWLS